MANQKPAKLKLTKLDWLSSCDFPAQGEGGAALLLKRNADEFSLKAKVSKLSDELGLVFGYAFASSMDGGKTPHVDYQNDAIDPDFLKVVTAFIEDGGKTDVNHDFEKDGKIVYAWPLLPEINKAMGISADVIGLAVAVKPSAETYKRFKDGELTGFSIAGEGARQPLEKARTTKQHPTGRGAPVKKSVSLYTDEVDGHQHQIDICEDGSMWCSWATSAGADTTHSHAVSQDANGGIVILADSGHTHALADGQPALVFVPEGAIVVQEGAESDAVEMRAPSTNRTAAKLRARESSPSNTGRNVALMSTNDTQIADLTKRLERADRIVKMTGAHKTFFDSLAGDDAEAFLAKTAAERDAVIKAAADADPVEVEFDGVQYRKSMGAQVVALAKSAKAAAEQVEKAAIEKAAIEIFGMADDAAVDLVKAVRAFKATPERLTKMNERLKSLVFFERKAGKAPGSDGADPSDVSKSSLVAKFNAKLAEFAKTVNKTPAAAHIDFVRTPEGAELYAQATAN